MGNTILLAGKAHVYAYVCVLLVKRQNGLGQGQDLLYGVQKMCNACLEVLCITNIMMFMIMSNPKDLQLAERDKLLEYWYVATTTLSVPCIDDRILRSCNSE